MTIRLRKKPLPQLERICNEAYDKVCKYLELAQSLNHEEIDRASNLYRELWTALNDATMSERWPFVRRGTQTSDFYDRYALQCVLGIQLSDALKDGIRVRKSKKNDGYDKPLRELILDLEQKSSSYATINNNVYQSFVRTRKLDLLKRALDYVREQYR